MAVTENYSRMNTDGKDNTNEQAEQHGMSTGVAFAMAAAGSLMTYSLTEEFAASTAVGVGATALIYCVGRAMQLMRE